MRLPFTPEQFFQVFGRYNMAVWPAQYVLLGVALVAVLLVSFRRPGSGRWISAILAALWIWTAVAYHIAFFSRINPLAYAFAAVFLIGAALFLWHGVFRGNLRFQWSHDAFHYAGALLVVYALLVYPLWNRYTGHIYLESPTFGLPCPTTLFSVGMLAMAVPGAPRGPLWMPILWCLVGGQAALLLDVPPDFGLFVAAVVALALVLRRAHPRKGGVEILDGGN